MASIVMLAFLASSVAVTSGAAAAEQSPDGSTGKDVAERSMNFVFASPDLIATVATPDGGEIILEAFKSVHNDEFLANLHKSHFAAEQQTDLENDAGQLMWVSVGHPTFVATPDPSETTKMRLFHFTPSGFYTYVQMLTAEQRHLLAAVANNKYHGINASDEQVTELILSQFKCSLNYDGVDADYGFHVVSGNVADFASYPLRMDFVAPLGGVERNLVSELIGNEEHADLQFTCQMASRDKVTKSRTLTIDVRRLEELGLVDALFKPLPETAFVASSDAVYVTRRQLVDMATQMYWTLSIENEFRMAEDQFVEAFVTDLIALTSIDDFAMVPTDVIAAADELSSYGFDSGPDFRTDQALDDLGRILTVGGPTDVIPAGRRIVVDEPKYEDLRRFGRSGDVANLLGAEYAVEWARANAARASTDVTTTIDDQLKELNNVTQTDVEWSVDVRDADRIVPKALRVARLERSRFYRTLTFGRVHLKTTDAAFEQQFSMYTMRAVGLASATASSTTPTVPASPAQATDAAERGDRTPSNEPSVGSSTVAPDADKMSAK